MSNILVTGGAGYIGSHACKKLAAAGFTPVVFDNLCYGHREAVKWGPLVEGDLLDRPAIDEVFKQYKPDAVIHFAAYAYVGESVTNPQKYYRNNVQGGLALLDTMLAHGCKHLVFSSTCATYGMPEQVPILESETQQPINPYGSSKLMFERILQDYDVAYDLRSIKLRYFNAAGADFDGEIGEKHDPETHLIPLVLQAALGERSHIEIYGDDYDTPDGSCIRDYIHVNDLADAHVLALQALLNGSESEAFNLGTGKGLSVKQIIDSCQQVTGKTIDARVSSRRPGDPARLVASNSLAKAKLGWQPNCSDIGSIIQSAWHWHNNPAF